jgi:hypothetical protein
VRKSTEQMLDELFESLDEDEDMRKQAKKTTKRIIAKRVFVQGPPGPQGPQGPQGPTGKAEQSHVTDSLNYMIAGLDRDEQAAPVWLSEATEPGLYVIKNSEGLRTIRVVVQNDGVEITKFARYTESALGYLQVHIDILRNSTFQKIKE